MCSVKNCRGPNEMMYYGKYICFDCYNKHCAGKINLKELFKIAESEAGIAQVEADKLIGLKGYM